MVRKTEKFRGSRTHGRGRKGGRGHGANGGRGNAGLHKHKMKFMIKYMPDHFGRHGFKRPQGVSDEPVTINISGLEDNLQKYIAENKAKVEAGVVTIDLGELGVDKLLGKGKPTRAYKIKVASASAKAVDLIKNAGGAVELA